MRKIEAEEMPIEIIKKLIKQNLSEYKQHIKKIKQAEKYYKNKNDILYGTGKEHENKPLRNADNRIPRNFHGLLVNQKASYLFTAPPIFDVGNRNVNKQIENVLGDRFAKTCKDLCVNASNASVAWLHYWIDEKNSFNYGIVDTKQIIPLFSGDLNKKLRAVLRTYQDIDNATGNIITIWEYWNDRYCSYYYKKSNTISNTNLEPYQISLEDGSMKGSNVYEHGWSQIPFIAFLNNNVEMDDLENIKPLMDAYDKVFSGFLNDLEDTQEIIFILTNYGGVDLNEFLTDLKKYKTIKINGDADGSGKGGIETLTISIPFEARKEFLETTRKAIFEQGQGLDPDPQRFGNTSGESLKYLYSLLELKAGLMEMEFKLSFGELIRVIGQHIGFECKQIIQTWTRTAIRSESELVEIAAKSVGVISNKTILKNHPWVESAEEEENQLKIEKEEREKESDLYQQAFVQDVQGEKKDLEGGEVVGGKKQ